MPIRTTATGRQPRTSPASSGGRGGSAGRLPAVNLFDVKSFGAAGDGVADDTVSIRAAITAALASRVSTGVNATVYFPAGTYNVCRQGGDSTAGLGFFRPIFQLPTGGVDFLGDGPALSVVKGFMPGLADPNTTWVSTGDSGFPVQRFGLFQIVTAAGTGPAAPVSFEGLALDGQAGYTGDFTVGGNPSTGDGWDLTHKCVQCDGARPIAAVSFTDCDLRNWRGEVVYGGGTALQTLAITNTVVRGSNASAVSASAPCTIRGSRIGANPADPLSADRVYNCVENFDIDGTQFTDAFASSFCCGLTSARRGFGIAYLGVSGARLRAVGCDFRWNQAAVLLHQLAHGVTLEGCSFTDDANGVILNGSVAYPEFTPGFSEVTLAGVTSNSGLLTPQGQDITDLLVTGGTLTAGAVLAGVVGAMPNGVVTGVDLTGGKDQSSGSGRGFGQVAWTGLTRPSPPYPAIGQKVDVFSGAVASVAPISDAVFLNANTGTGSLTLLTAADTLSPNVGRDYFVGWTTTLFAAADGWSLAADPARNTFSADVPVPNGGSVTVRVNSDQLWEVAP